MNKCFVAGAILVAFVFSPCLVFSQARHGAIEGTVYDEDKNPLPGVEVRISSPDLIGGDQFRVTDERGNFRFLAISRGTYAVEATLAGFVPLRRENVRLFVGQTITLDMVLRIGTLEEEMIVIARAPLVDVRDSQVSVTHLDESTIREIAAATLDRSATSGLLNLTPYTESSSAAGSSSRSGVQWQIDGNVVSDLRGGRDWTYPDINFVEEAQTAGFGANAEYGGFTGVTFNTMMKSGSNIFGGIFDIGYSGLGWRAQNIDVNEPKFSLYREPPRSLRFHAHLGMGGAIIRDKLWYYAGAGQRQTDTELHGFEQRTSYRTPNWMAKFTYQMDSKNKFELMAWWELFLYLNRGFSVYRAPEFAYEDVGPDFTLSLSHLHSFSDRTYSELRIGYFWVLYDQRPNQGKNVSQRRDMQTGIYTGNYGYWGESASAHISARSSLTHHVDDFIMGSHDFKFGVDLLSGYDERSWGHPGGYSYQDNVFNPVTQTYHTYAETDGGFLKSTAYSLSFYAQDSWRMARGLTLNFGARYSLMRGTLPNVSSSPIFAPKNHIDPRIGLTWDVFGDHTTAFKVHYGRYHDGLKTGYFDGADVGVDDYVLYEVMDDGLMVEVFRSVYSNPTSVDPNIRVPCMDQFTLGLDRTLTQDLSVGLSFVYREYGNILARVNTTAVWDTIPFTFRNENGQWQTIDIYRKLTPASDDQFMITNPDEGMPGVLFTPKNEYIGFTLNLTKRFSRGWMLSGYYTYGKAEGNHDITAAGGITGGTRYLNPNLQINAYGSLDVDPTHTIRTYGTFSLPYGFRVSPNITYRTGGNWTRRIIGPAAAARASIFLDRRGSERVSPYIDLSLRVDKTFHLSEKRNIGLILDMSNVFNRGVETSVESRVDSVNFLKATGVSSPRAYRVSLRFFF